MADNVSSEDIKIRRRIFQDLANLRNDASFSDITVVAGGTAFRCHRAILAAVSEFFYAAFKSDMRETGEGKITLHNIDADVFSTLLTSTYNGKYVLTEGNLFQVWAAADMLQIQFLLPLCEKLFETKLSSTNCVDFCCKVRLLNEKAKQQALELICSNFREYSIQKEIHLLEREEIMFLVANNSLDVLSEDDVIESVLRWAGHRLKTILHETVGADSSGASCQDVLSESVDSPKWYLSQHLADVLECSRYLLVSGHCLHETLARHPLVKGNPRCQDLVDTMARYQVQPHLHQTWCPPAAVQREQNSTRTVLIQCQLADGVFPMLELTNEIMRWKTIDYWSLHPAAHNGGILFHTYKGYMLTENNIFVNVPKIPECQSIPVSQETSIVRAIGNSLYLYSIHDGVVEIKKHSNLSHIFDLNKSQKNYCITISDQNLNGMSITDVSSIRNTHIVFFSSKDSDNYTIGCIDTITYSYKLHPMQLSSRSPVVTIRHDDQVLALQENGWLWRIQLSADGPVDIKLSEELLLWNGSVVLNGAVLYNDQLIVVGDFQFQDQTEITQTVGMSVEGVFQSVKKTKRYSSPKKRCSKISLASISV